MPRKVMLVAALTLGLAGAFWAAEPAPAAQPPEPPAAPGAEAGKKDLAPDELPTHLIKVLRTTNKAQTNRYVPKAYTVNNVNPYELFRWVRRVAQIEEGGFYFFGKRDEKGVVRSGKVVVTAPEYMLPGMDEMMKNIDRANLTSSSGEEFFYFRPLHRNVADAGFTNLIQAVRGTTGDFHADTEANMVMLYAAPSKQAELLDWLPKIDTPQPQVMIEATVYEVYVDNEARLGLDYVAWKNGPGRNLFALGAFAEREKVSSLDGMTPLLNTGTGGTYALPGHMFKASGSNAAWFLDVPSAFFDFLVVKGKARVMTSAKLATRNLVTASLSAGDTVLYYQSRVGPAANAGQRPAGLPLDPNDVPTTGTPPVKSNVYPDNRTVVSTQTNRIVGAKSGLSLTIKPIIAENEIDLDIVASLVSHTGLDDKGAPVLVTRTVDTDVRVRDDQEVILGGMMREVMIERSDKIPILGSLPLIGYLFGGDGTTTEKRQIVVVCRPHVIRDFSAMEYKGTQIDAALIRSKAQQPYKAATPVPKTSAGFDQWLLDLEQ